METEAENAQGPQSGGTTSLTIAILIVAVAAIGFALVIRPAKSRPMAPRRAPEIAAAGWLNGPGPTAEDLEGKVIVLDAWAFWCGPCRAAAPEMVHLYDKYRDKGVVFLGLTGEGAEADAQNRRFLTTYKIAWPNGYGAVKTLTDLKAEFIPQRWVIDRKYNLIWDENSSEKFEAAIDRALAEEP